MGAIITCSTSYKENFSKEIKLNLIESPISKNKLLSQARNANLKSFKSQKEEINKDFKSCNSKEKENNKTQKIPKPIAINSLNNAKKANIINKTKGKIIEYNYEFNKTNKKDDDCDIIEFEDEIDNNKNIINLMQNYELTNNRSIKYFYGINDKLKRENKTKENNEDLLLNNYNNRNLNIDLNINKNKTFGDGNNNNNNLENLIIENNNENKDKYNDYENQNDLIKKYNNINNNKIYIKTNRVINCYGSKNSNSYRNEISKAKENNIVEKTQIIGDIDKEETLDNKMNEHLSEKQNLNENKNNLEFQNNKIDDYNINYNNNLNNINNVSSINNNSELNNNNCIDASSNMTYLLTVEKSNIQPISNVRNKNAHKYNDIIYNKVINNNYKNYFGINKYKRKLLPKYKYKYNTQICKSFSNSQSFSTNEDNQKNSQFSNINKEFKSKSNNPKNLKIKEIESKKDIYEENNLFFNEFKKQDEKIKSLQDKIKYLYEILEKEKNKELKNESKIFKLKEFMSKAEGYFNEKNKKKLILYKNENNHYKNIIRNIKYVETQKDNEIQKLEEHLDILEKNIKITKNLLKKKDKQIHNLINSKRKQDEIIKKYKALNNSNKKEKKINFFKEIENNNLLANKTPTSNILKNNNFSKMTLKKDVKPKKLNKSLNLQLNNNKFKKGNKQIKNDIKIEKTNKKKINETKYIRKEMFQKEKNNSSKGKVNNKDKNKIINTVNKKFSINNRNINYANYCNSLNTKSKSKYSNKISLNRIKIYKFNNLPTFEQATKSSKYKDKKIPKKNFSSKKTGSKKISKDFEEDLKEMYLKAGTIKNELKNIDNDINDNFNETKLEDENNKNKINTSSSLITNNITNLSTSPIFI